jgi:hypothetical protein
MKIFRRILGLFVMIAGILGLLLSLAGLVGIWMAKTPVLGYATTTIDTLQKSITTSQDVMEITIQALGATIDSVDALSEMLSTTALTVEDTQPVVVEIDAMLAETLPTTMSATIDSLFTAQEAAVVMESSIKTLDNFRFLLSATPLIGAMVEAPTEAYNPEKPLADSLGELAITLEDLPVTFVAMAESLSGTDENLGAIQANLTTMSSSVSLISTSLAEYQGMIQQSQASMDDVSSILTNLQASLESILKWVALGLTLFMVWLLAAQVVIFSQGWELYQGTADRMESDDKGE